MAAVLSQSLPILTWMVAGFLFRQARILRPDDGHTMARVIINATLPSLLFLSLARAELAAGSILVLSFCGAAIPLVLQTLARLAARAMRLEKPVAGVLVISTMVSNIGFFLVPFFLTFYGTEGISRLAAFDLGNSLVGNSYAYYTATRHGTHASSAWQAALKRVLALPTFWANILGITVNLAGLSLPAWLVQILEPVSKANGPLAMLTLGAFIELRFSRWRPMLVAVALRIAGGWLAGQALVAAFGLQGLERAAVAMGAAMPIGIVVLVYASMEGLDTDFAAGAISLSMLVALAITPFLLAAY
ncbi:MAG: AEC family transporter [Chloroflexi bacterium]|nr:AEC family transporter [Chloroflexota bacterium]